MDRRKLALAFLALQIISGPAPMIGLTPAHLYSSTTSQAAMPADAPRISAAELARALPGSELAVLDVRRDEEFNGWQLNGEPRGGHIPGAVQVTPEWLTRPDGSPESPARIRELLARSGVTTDRRLVVATTGAERTASAYQALRKAGFASVMLLQGGLGSWLADPRLPLEQLPGHRLLVPPAWLDAARRGASVAEPPAGPVLIFDVSWGKGDKSYDTGHIPGALHIDTNVLEADTDVQPRGFWRLLPPAQLQASLEKLGITRDSTVVLYSDPNMAAARAAWALIYAGVRDVRLLNGGLRAWKREGLPVETAPAPAPVARAFGATLPLRPEVRRDTLWVRDHLSDTSQRLADIRSWDEHIGKVTGYDTVTGKGRIPGSRWAKGGAHPQTLVGDYEDEDGTFRAYTEVDRMWRTWDLPPEKPMTFYCGTGWRASVGYLYARMMDRPQPAVYDSGWMEWCMGPTARINPVVTGKP